MASGAKKSCWLPTFSPFSKILLTLITELQILDSSKLKKSADNIFKFDENGQKVFKRVENTV